MCAIPSNGCDNGARDSCDEANEPPDPRSPTRLSFGCKQSAAAALRSIPKKMAWSIAALSSAFKEFNDVRSNAAEDGCGPPRSGSAHLLHDNGCRAEAHSDSCLMHTCSVPETTLCTPSAHSLDRARRTIGVEAVSFTTGSLAHEESMDVLMELSEL